MADISALYVHLPFCHTICPFCAFAVHRDRPGLHRPYLDELAVEIARRAAEVGGDRQRVTSVYFGGGTPSTLGLPEVAGLLETLRAAFGLAPDAEIAFEVNPEDATAPYLRGLLALGVDRISLGVQSLDDATLAALGRNHRRAESLRALAAAREAGVGNLNLDLMLGAPGVPARRLLADLAEVLQATPEHLSLYVLDLEPGTRFARDAAVRQWSETHREEQAEVFLEAAARLEARGYRHYEVSNFCLPGREGRQNRLVWDGADYLGFGVGAHSFVAGVRWHNVRHVRAYGRLLAAGELPVAAREVLTPQQLANERLMLELRRDSGFAPQPWSERFGFGWEGARERVARELEAGGLLRREAGRLVLTPRGLLLADAITERLMVG
ncbi:MAG: radical SAM family heme chaperone HemW [Candidatus Lambdaproteobacteria bacterium]|nr:radical SAM family heme chaperone HemW [Candidatus Lambdaproteobacteria bacterium]